MAKRVTGRGKRGKKLDRLTRAERRARLTERQGQWIERWLALAKTFVEMVLNREVAELLGRPSHQWGDRAEQVEVNARCNRCGRQHRGWFRRNGTYPRSLLMEGVAIDFRVPRVRCGCGGTVDVSFSVFIPHQRVSSELAERLREAVALGLNLQQTGAMTAPANGGSLAKSTINARLLEVNRLAEAFHRGALEWVPPVILVDGIWVKVMEATGERFVDQAGRDRPRVRCKRIGLLVAYGVDPGSGEWGVLDWERAQGEDAASWERLLERLRERGVSAERGLKLIVSDGSEGLAAALELVDLGPEVRHQLCVFHKLRNVSDAVKAVQAASREEKRQRRREVVKAAAAIYQGQDRAEILGRRAEFVARWQGEEPEAVATLLRNFEKTIVYLEVAAAAAAEGEQWAASYLRTTSALERLNRSLRKMVRSVVLFHSDAGLEARVYLTLLQAGKMLTPRAGDWLEALEEDLTAA